MLNMKRMINIAVGMLIVCLLPLAAFAQSGDWQSTSALPGSGSAYSSQVTAVGASNVTGQATTAGSAPAKAISIRPRRDDNDSGGAFGEGAEVTTTIDYDNSPIGDALLPLLLMAAGFAGYTVLRRRGRQRV